MPFANYTIRAGLAGIIYYADSRGVLWAKGAPTLAGAALALCANAADYRLRDNQ
ncbi:MAG: hypothetical protein ACR2P4_02545 [Gammaproteobacteria bacterium]